MTLDESQQTEELLLAWHRWQDTYRPALKMPGCAPACREYRTGIQWLTPKDRAELADQKIQKANSEQVDVCVDTLTWQHRAAIQTSMRNKRVGHDVFSNPRLTPEELHALYQSAKALLFPMFLSRGLIKPEPIEKNFDGDIASNVEMH